MLPLFVGYILALIIGCIIIKLSGGEPISAYKYGFYSAFHPLYSFYSTLWSTVPLLLVSLGVAISFNSGIFNVGGDGQLYLGAFMATWIGFTLSVPHFIHPIICLIFGALGGGIWALIPAFLKIKYKISEVVTCIMLNYIAFLIIDYFIVNIYKTPYGAGETTKAIFSTAEIRPFVKLSNFNWSFFMSVGLIIVVYYLMTKTAIGYEWRMIGLNSTFAKYGGVQVNKMIIKAMFISGMFAGLSGALKVIGEQYVMTTNINANLGFKAIIISLISKNNPLVIPIVCFIFAITESSAVGMEISAGIPSSLSEVLEAIIMIIIIFYMGVQKIIKKRSNFNE